jgi:hypothetical protein
VGAGAKGLVVMGGFSPRRLEGRRGDIFHREDAKGAKVGYCMAGWFSDPWHGDLACVFVTIRPINGKIFGTKRSFTSRNFF